VLLKETIDLPEGIEVRLEGDSVEVSGERGKLRRRFDFPKVTLRAEGRKIIVEAESNKRRDKAALGTVKAHLRNMFKGVKEGFTYKLRVVYSHFPIKVEVGEGRVLIHNFLGEKYPRVAKIVGGTQVRVDGDEILVSGINKEEVGQTAINIERATAVRYRDRRVFQDGCYLVEKG
jgi:large subunit ribosomal protein L6